MKFYNDVEGLLRPYPMRWFKMVHIIRHVANGRRLDRRERHAMKMGVLRVLEMMHNIEVIDRRPNVKRGGPAFYKWKVAHAEIAEWH